jgi:hypothetical protein
MQNGKAERLAILAKIHGINVPRFIVLYPTMSECESVEAIRSFLREMPNGSTVAVRSSAIQEDSANASFAGMYATKLRISATVCDVQAAVKEVFASGEGKEEVISHYATSRSIELIDARVSVIIQEMIDADMSGVMFSHSPTEADGYYIVSISKGIGEDIVRGASNGELIRIARGIRSEDIDETWLQQLVGAMRVIEQRFQSTGLDVEFAFRSGTLYILQCRPITTVQTVAGGMMQEEKLLRQIKSLNASIESDFSKDVLGDMIDINPRELLGDSPTLLDISIFNYLFADKIVEQVRRDMGYDPLDIGLLRVVAGKPYVSMRATAFSFRPYGIPDRIYERIVSVYRDKLAKNPALQSRVEFDLYAMSVGDKLEQVMREAKLDGSDKGVVRDAFVRIDSIFHSISESYSEIFKKSVQDYEQQTASLDDAPLDIILEHVAVGTRMFVWVARLAFYWKNKFEEMHPRENLNDLIAGHIHSVNGQIQVDLVACRNGFITRDDLVRRYGHLRPGQFSVFGESYADDPDNYLFTQMGRAKVVKSQKRTHVFEDTVEFKNVITFMQAREQVKFLFAQSFHLFATKLKHQLTQQDILKQDASRLNWEELNAHLVTSSSLKASRKEDPPRVLLPDVIIPGLSDLRVIRFAEANPSYITNSVVKARLCVVEQQSVKTDVKNALVLLPNADPGYDFLFHSGVAGIITKVGGPASHMCIRAIELQMPACIGCGESMYQMLVSVPNAILDCASRQIIALD